MGNEYFSNRIITLPRLTENFYQRVYLNKGAFLQALWIKYTLYKHCNSWLEDSLFWFRSEEISVLLIWFWCTQEVESAARDFETVDQVECDECTIRLRENTRRRSRTGLPNWREMEKIVIFLGRPLSSEVTQKESEGGRKLWRQHHGILGWNRAKEKMHLWMITEGKRNSFWKRALIANSKYRKK